MQRLEVSGAGTTPIGVVRRQSVNLTQGTSTKQEQSAVLHVGGKTFIHHNSSGRT